MLGVCPCCGYVDPPGTRVHPGGRYRTCGACDGLSSSRRWITHTRCPYGHGLVAVSGCYACGWVMPNPAPRVRSTFTFSRRKG